MSDIFISYAREDRPRVERLAAALEQRGWAVWWDPDIRTGEDFGRRIHTALQAARCVIVVWSHQSIASPWVKDEAQVGQERGVLLPVCIDAVAPPLGFRQLQTVNLTGWRPGSPGAAFAKLVADIATMLGDHAGYQPEEARAPTVATWVSMAWLRRRKLLLAGPAVVAVAVVAYGLVPRTPAPPTEPPVVVAPRTPEPPVTWPPPDDRVPQAIGQCQATWQARARTLAAEPGNTKVLDAQADCGMVLVAHARTTGNEARFRDVVDPITPVLYQALETARGARAADLLAHLGWADFLRSKDGVGGLRPESFYRRALEQDPNNPYANAMWGHRILWQRGALAEAQARFQRALASGREREYVRWLQLVALMLFSDAPLEFETVRVANEMRGNGEPVPTNDAEQLVWSKYWNLYYHNLLGGTQQAAFLAILPPAEHLATFRWLFPESQMPANKLHLWVLFLATFQERNGERPAARANYAWLRAALRSEHASGRVLDQTEEGLRRLSGSQE
jgi:tetratricopeptide (TPR) repeat protein